MINYSKLDIKRAIMHKILSKSDNDDPQAECSDKLISLDDDIKRIFRDRMSDSFSQVSRSLKLAIDRIEADSAFGYIKLLHEASDDEFIQYSKALADLLAEQQNKKNIPNGYLIILDAVNDYKGQEVEILIKAESQSAFNIGRELGIDAVKNIIMSPASKLYKAASFVKFANNGLASDYDVWLFDEQFSTRSSLAEYFYRKFLGLTVNKNDKVLNKLFFDGMLKYIKDFYKNDLQKQAELSSQLVAEANNKEFKVSPRVIIDRMIDIKDRDKFYEHCITNEMPPTFGKDISLIKNKVNLIRLEFPESFKCSFPFESEKNIIIDRSSDKYNIIIKIPKKNGSAAS